MVDNDVDAFRHAYVSGVFTQEYNVYTAQFLGFLQESFGGNGSSTNSSDEAKNMDYWNNSIGRKYGKRTKSRTKLLELIHRALNNGELIIELKDKRKYPGDMTYIINPNKPVIAVQKSKTNRNEIFLDLSKKMLLTRDNFVAQIQKGVYPGYKIVNRNNLLIPMSIQDKEINNNLG